MPDGGISMAFNQLNNLVKVLRTMIEEEITKRRGLGYYIVTDVQEETYTVNIRHLNFQKLTYDNVPLLGIGLGNLRGVMNLPEVDDIVVAAFLDKSPYPVVLGSVFDTFTQSRDLLPEAKTGEFFLTNRRLGAIVFINQNNDIIFSSPDKTTKIKIKSDGDVEITSPANISINGNAVQVCSGSNGFARVGDSVEVSVPTHGTCTGTITSGSSKVTGGD
jgi:hypothetical protein